MIKLGIIVEKIILIIKKQKIRNEKLERTIQQRQDNKRKSIYNIINTIIILEVGFTIGIGLIFEGQIKFIIKRYKKELDSFAILGIILALELGFLYLPPTSSSSFVGAPILTMAKKRTYSEGPGKQEELSSSLGELSQEERVRPEISSSDVSSSRGGTPSSEELSSQGESPNSTSSRDEVLIIDEGNVPRQGNITLDSNQSNSNILVFNTDDNPSLDFINNSNNAPKIWEDVKKEIVENVKEQDAGVEIININNLNHPENPYNSIIFVNGSQLDYLKLLDEQEMIILPTDKVGYQKGDVNDLNQENWNAIGPLDNNESLLGLILENPRGLLPILSFLYLYRNYIYMIYNLYENRIKLILLFLIYFLILFIIIL